MKSDEFLTDDKTYEKAAAAIMKNCGPFLRQIKNLSKDILYRGIGYPSHKLMFKGECPVNRAPTDMPRGLHIAADEWFLKKTGIRYRSNALFCTGDDYVASGYGYAYAIFPIGDFSFCYSASAGDLLYTLKDFEYYNDITTPEGIAKLDRILTKCKYRQTDLRKAIASGSEIMLHCTTYYAINIEPTDNNSSTYAEIIKHINRGMLA